MTFTWTKNAEKSCYHDRDFPVIVRHEISQWYDWIWQNAVWTPCLPLSRGNLTTRPLRRRAIRQRHWSSSPRVSKPGLHNTWSDERVIGAVHGFLMSVTDRLCCQRERQRRWYKPSDHLTLVHFVSHYIAIAGFVTGQSHLKFTASLSVAAVRWYSSGGSESRSSSCSSSTNNKRSSNSKRSSSGKIRSNKVKGSMCFMAGNASFQHLTLFYFCLLLMPLGVSLVERDVCLLHVGMPGQEGCYTETVSLWLR